MVTSVNKRERELDMNITIRKENETDIQAISEITRAEPALKGIVALSGCSSLALLSGE